VLQEPIAQGTPEPVSRPESVDHIDPVGRYLHLPLTSLAQDTFGPLLDDCDLHASLQKRIGGTLRVALPDRDLALLHIAHGHRDVLKGPLHLLASFLR